MSKPAGAAHALISGPTGSGKTTLAAQLIAESQPSGGLVQDWLADPQHGHPYGALRVHVDRFAVDVTEITLMLDAAVDEMNRRQEVLAASGQTWQRTPAMPLIVITLDELHSYINDRVIIGQLWQLVDADMVGIALRGVTQTDGDALTVASGVDAWDLFLTSL